MQILLKKELNGYPNKWMRVSQVKYALLWSEREQKHTGLDFRNEVLRYRYFAKNVSRYRYFVVKVSRYRY